MKVLIRRIDGARELYRDDRTGIAWVKDSSDGCEHSCHSNIDSTGSVSGMKMRGGWAKGARCVRTNGFIFNIDSFLVSDEWNEVASENCQCQACIERRARESNS